MPDNSLSLPNDTKDGRTRELEQEFSFEGYQVVRRELFAHHYDPAMTIRRDSVTFNRACIRGLKDTIYIHMLINPDTMRIVVKKCDEDDKNALRWCVARQDKRVSRTISGKHFSAMLYRLLDWDDDCRYKILGYRIYVNGEVMYIFDLLEPEVFLDLRKRKPEKASADARVSRTASAVNASSDFGVSPEENQMALKVSKTGVRRCRNNHMSIWA